MSHPPLHDNNNNTGVRSVVKLSQDQLQFIPRNVRLEVMRRRQYEDTLTRSDCLADDLSQCSSQDNIPVMKTQSVTQCL
jgi:hypothetical protein